MDADNQEVVVICCFTPGMKPDFFATVLKSRSICVHLRFISLSSTRTRCAGGKGKKPQQFTAKDAKKSANPPDQAQSIFHPKSKTPLSLASLASWRLKNPGYSGAPEPGVRVWKGKKPQQFTAKTPKKAPTRLTKRKASSIQNTKSKTPLSLASLASWR